MKTILLTNIFSDFFENLQSQLLLMYVENIFLFIVISTAILFIVSAPVLLFYTTLDNYFKWKMNKTLITSEICCEETINHPTFVNKFCNNYKKSYAGFLGSLLGLTAWNVASLLYIFSAFPDFKTGVVDYLLFPFDVVATYNSVTMVESISQYSSNWLYMFTILAITAIFYQVGKILAPLKTKNKLLKGFKNLSWA